METLSKKNSESVEKAERTTAGRKTFAPNVDIISNDKAYTLIADMPGVNEKSVDITLEKSVLTITGKTTQCKSDGYERAYREYEDGDYYRSFTLTDEIDKKRIEASVKNGVLRLTLPRTKPVSQKIEVRAA